MDKEKLKTFAAFKKKALQRLEDKKKSKFLNLYIPSLDDTIKIRSLSKAEVMEIYEIEDVIETDIYTVYLGVVEPNLKELASDLKAEGAIKEYTEIVDIFNFSERSEIVRQILTLSGVSSDKKVEVVENLKNW